MILAAIVVALAGCVTTRLDPQASSPASAGPTPTARPLPTGATATASVPTPTPFLLAIAFAELPALRPDSRTGLEICDPAPGQALPEYVDELLTCSDGIEYGLRAIATVTSEPIVRAYLHLPRCSSAPCSDEQRSTGTVTAWTETAVWTTHLDIRSETATPPVLDPDPAWPNVDAPLPVVKRPRIEGAPAEIANRKPLPFCGHSELGNPGSVPRCFISAVLAGRPAESIDTRYGTEGGTSLQIVRFTGSGLIVGYEQGVDADGQTLGWYRYAGGMILGVETESWTVTHVTGNRDLP